MESPSRVDVVVKESYCILRGLHSKGVDVYGPFDFAHEAVLYAERHFKEDTWELVSMIKEE